MKAKADRDLADLQMQAAEARSKRFATKAAVMRLDQQRRNGG